MWQRLKEYFSQEIIDAFQLEDSVSESKLTRLESHLGQSLPEEFKVMLMQHDGQCEGALPMFFGIFLLPAEFMLYEAADLEHASNRVGSDYRSSSTPDGAIKSGYYNSGWLPFLSNYCGSYLALDFNPGPNGVVGQVINCGSDDHEKFVIASSFKEFIKIYFQQLDTFDYQIAKDPAEDELFWLMNDSDLLLLYSILCIESKYQGKD